MISLRAEPYLTPPGVPLGRLADATQFHGDPSLNEVEGTVRHHQAHREYVKGERAHPIQIADASIRYDADGSQPAGKGGNHVTHRVGRDP